MNSIKLYISVTTSICIVYTLALLHHAYCLFYLCSPVFNTTFLLSLLATSQSSAVFLTLIVSLKSIYASLESHKPFLNPIQYGLFRGCSWMGGSINDETRHAYTLPNEDAKDV